MLTTPFVVTAEAGWLATEGSLLPRYFAIDTTARLATTMIIMLRITLRLIITSSGAASIPADCAIAQHCISLDVESEDVLAGGNPSLSCTEPLAVASG